MAVTVLVLEHNPVARSFLCKVVRESFSDALDILEAGDVNHARRLLAAPGQLAPQLVLIDLELPEGDGPALLSEPATRAATRIVTTLFADDEHLYPALLAGAQGYLLKEDRFEVLVEALQRIARGQPPLSPAIARRLVTHFRDLPNPQAALSTREAEVLAHLSKGFTHKEIASLMGLKLGAVNEQILAIYRKMGAR